MSITESTMINVLNYSDNLVSVPSHLKLEGYLFECASYEQPFPVPLSFAEIKLINSKSNVFREGVLFFDPEYESEVYEKLGISNWEHILTDEQIRNTILHPTKEGLEKFIRITSASMFERVRGILIMLENSGMYDISMRVKSVVQERYKELYNNKRISEIQITSTSSDESQLPTIDVEQMKNELKAQLENELREKLKEELKEQFMAELAFEKNDTNNTTNEASKDEKDSGNNRGRPKGK